MAISTPNSADGPGETVDVDVPDLEVVVDAERDRGLRRLFRQLRRDKAAMAALAFLLFLVFVAIFWEQLAPLDPNSQDLRATLESPSADHWLGTDDFGRDTFSRLLSATRVSLMAAAEAVGIAVILGVGPGLIAGYVGGWVDATMSRFADGLLALPPLIIALAIVGVLGPGLTNAMLAVGIIFSPRFFRLARGAASSARREGYVEALESLGCSRTRIIGLHILPNTVAVLLVELAITAGAAITAEASLSFLGLGVSPPQASWGGMVRGGFRYVNDTLWPILPPVIVVVLTILSFTYLGEGIRRVVTRSNRVGE